MVQRRCQLCRRRYPRDDASHSRYSASGSPRKIRHWVAHCSGNGKQNISLQFRVLARKIKATSQHKHSLEALDPKSQIASRGNFFRATNFARFHIARTLPKLRESVARLIRTSGKKTSAKFIGCPVTRNSPKNAVRWLL